MNANLLDIKKTKYRYFIDNMKLFPVKPVLKYTIPVPKDPTVNEQELEFYDRKYPDVTITNVKMKRMIDLTAQALVAYGVKKGDIVTICQTNTPEMFYMDYALNKIGAIPNFIYPNVTADEMKFYIEELNSKFMFILDDAPIRKNVKEATSGTGIKIISSSVIESFPEIFKKIAEKKQPKQEEIKLENEIKWEDFIANGKGIKVEENEYVPNDLYAYIHSSGTSSTPKAIMMSNENANCTPINYALTNIEFLKNASCVQTIPLFVSYGIAMCHLLFCNNVCMVITPEMNPKNYYDLIHKYKPEYSYATPAHARELIKRPTDMSKAYLYGYGGDGFDDVEQLIADYIKENGGNSVPYQGYGSSELSSIGVLTYPGKYKKGSVGVVYGKNKVILIDPDSPNDDLRIIEGPNEPGEACITGLGVTLGYAGDSKEQNKNVYVKHNGETYVRMGDLISYDEEGFYYYHGRIKNVITRQSWTFSPDKIVKVIMEHPNVKQCVVVPRYSSEEGETPSAHIVLKNYDNKEETMEEIIALVNEKIKELHRPTHYKIREEITRTRNNKNDITALKIEDAALMYKGVVDATIKGVNDGEYDYQLDITINKSILTLTDDLIGDIDKFIRDISKLTKFKVGKIKYNINCIDFNYQDDSLNLDMPYSYVKRV